MLYILFIPTGANRKTLVEEKILKPVGLGVFGDFLYWADRDAQIIARVDKLNGQGWTKLIGDVTLLSDIVMVNGDMQGKRLATLDVTVKGDITFILCFHAKITQSENKTPQ